MHWPLPEVQLRKLRVSFHRIIVVYIVYIAISSEMFWLPPVASVSPFSRNCAGCSRIIISPMMTGGNKGTRKERKTGRRERSEVSPMKPQQKLRGQFRSPDYTGTFLLTSALRRIKIKDASRTTAKRSLRDTSSRDRGWLGTWKAKGRREATIKRHWNIACRYILHGAIPFCLWPLRILTRW